MRENIILKSGKNLSDEIAGTMFTLKDKKTAVTWLQVILIKYILHTLIF